MRRLVMTFFLLTALLYGVELRLEQHYVGPEKLTVSDLGVNMGLPRHWRAVARKGEGLLLFQHESNDTMVLRAETMNAAEALAYLNESHYLDDSVKIFPLGQIVKLSSTMFRRDYAVNGGDGRKSALIYLVLGPQERAVVMKAAYASADDSAVKATAMSIAQTITFTPTKQLKNALQDLEMRLRGTHLTYAERDGGHSDARELWLCSNRRYLLVETATAADGMSRSKVQRSGRWSVEKRALILQDDDGSDRLIGIKREENALIFDGQRAFELENHRCR